MHARKLAAPVVLALVFTLMTSAQAAARSDRAVANEPSIFVHVIAAGTVLPVPSAEVVVAFLEGDPDSPIVTGVVYDAKSNPGGHVFLDGLKPGLYVVTASAGGFVPFGNPGNVGRPPTGFFVVLSPAHQGPAHVTVRLTALCGDCRPPS